MAAFGSGAVAGDLFDDGNDDDALWQARNVMFDGWETASKRGRIALARRALKISDLCVGAYVLLAEAVAKSIVDAREYYVRGVVA